MSYEFFISESGKFLCVQVKQDITHKFALELAKAAKQQGAAHRLDKYLFDLRGTSNTASIKDNNQVVNEDLGKLSLPPCTRTAVLVRGGDVSHNYICYACQRVGYNVKLFTRQEEAIAWLDAP